MAQAITTKAKEKMVKARAGIIILPKVSSMAFGTGGCDINDQPLPVDPDAPLLRNELLRKDINTFSFPSNTSCRYSVTLLKTELVDQKITEVALFDSEGDILVIKTFKPKQKDGDMEMVFEIDDVF